MRHSVVMFYAQIGCKLQNLGVTAFNFLLRLLIQTVYNRISLLNGSFYDVGART